MKFIVRPWPDAGAAAESRFRISSRESGSSALCAGSAVLCLSQSLLTELNDCVTASASSSSIPVVSQGDLIFLVGFLWLSSITELQSKETELVFFLGSLISRSSEPKLKSNFVEDSLLSIIFPSLFDELNAVCSCTDGSASRLNLAPHTLQNLAPSATSLPQLLQNIVTSQIHLNHSSEELAFVLVVNLL